MIEPSRGPDFPPSGPPGPSEPGGPSPAEIREASGLFHAGVALLPVMTAALVLGLDLTIRDALFVSALLGTLPLLSMAQLPLLHGARVERVSAYAGSAGLLTGLACVGLVLGYFGPGLPAMGLEPRFDSGTWWTVGGVLAGVVVLGLAFHLAGEWFGLEESPILLDLIPRTGPEKGLFAVLSLAAGFGEEVVYRGYLLAVLGPIFAGPWVAAAVSSMAFAVLHAYQGPVGIIRSGLLGFLFAAAFIQTGDLWPLIAVHTAVDLVSGLLLGPRMLEPDGPNE